MGDSYLGMLHNDPYSDYNYYSSQLYVPAERTNSTNKKTIIHAIICRGNIFDRSGLLRSHVAFPANSVHAMVFISVWLTLMVNKYSCVSQCAHAWQIKNLAETNLSRFLVGPNKFCQSSASLKFGENLSQSLRAVPTVMLIHWVLKFLSQNTFLQNFLWSKRLGETKPRSWT